MHGGIKHMSRYNSVLVLKDYGRIEVKLSQVMDAMDITRNKLSTLTGVKYEVVDRYYKARNVEMVDLDFMAKACYVLDCDISDLLEYKISPDV